MTHRVSLYLNRNKSIYTVTAHASTGFTLIELMLAVAMSLSVILVALAGFRISKRINNHRTPHVKPK